MEDNELNERVSTFPKYKKGDVFVLDFGEYKSYDQNGNKNDWEYREYIFVVPGNEQQNTMVKVLYPLGDEKLYLVEMIHGFMYRYPSRGGRYSPQTKIENKTLYFKVKEKALIKDNVDKLMKFEDEKKFFKNERVSYSINGKFYSGHIMEISFFETLKNNKIFYKIDNAKNVISEEFIEKNTELSDIEIKLLIKEIEKKGNIKIKKHKYDDSKFEIEVESYSLTEYISNSELYFRSLEEEDEFSNKLQKFIDDNTDQVLQKIVKNNGSSLKILKKNYSNKEIGVTLEKKYVLQMAKNLGIDMNKFFDENEGRIEGDRYGI